MWYGKMTQELEKLYVKDIKKSLKLKKELQDFVE